MHCRSRLHVRVSSLIKRKTLLFPFSLFPFFYLINERVLNSPCSSIAISDSVFFFLNSSLFSNKLSYQMPTSPCSYSKHIITTISVCGGVIFVIAELSLESQRKWLVWFPLIISLPCIRKDSKAVIHNLI